MKPANLITMSIAAMTLASCGNQEVANKDQVIIEKSNIKIEGKRMTPEALWALGRIGGVSVSPDNKQIVYTVAYYSIPENKSNREVFIMNADGSDNKQITRTPFSENELTWIKGGSKLAFLSAESGSSQIWEMNPDGSERKQLTHYEGDIEGFSFSPDEKKLLFISQVKTVKATVEKYPDLPKATGIIVNDLMYKHWDEWVTTAPHPFIADFDGKSISNIKDVLEGEPYESPMKPFGGIEQLAWNTTSDKVAYTSRKKTGKEYALSTNSDIYVYDLNTKQSINITEGMPGYDTNPQYSPDGKSIAWLSMERDGYESDWNRLFIMDLATGEKRFISKSLDSNVDDYCWSTDSKTIYFTSIWHAKSQIYSVDVASEQVKPLTEGVHDYASVALCGDKLIAKRHSMSMADEIYSVDLSGKDTQLTYENKHIYDQLEMGKVEERWMTTTDGKQMLTWVIYPPNFDPNKKYPTILYCTGGPQNAVSQFWSYRWNMQMMAANDYIIVAPNRRGLPGFGLEWNEQISGDYSGQCMKDLFVAIDEVSKESFVDKDRLGCVGASFGGYTVYWMAGNHNKRFKAFIAHDGLFNLEAQYLETEEMWFANWDMGGAFWDKNNATAQRTFANSPHKFIDKWDTPILCIHGEKDYRVLATQGMTAFNAAVLRGIPAELLLYPDENHWVLKPQNGILWQRTFFKWLDKWLK
ncbi:S9 family peptidase [Bacteroides sp. 224]|uniref:S9 family peptidase n=1 Tax=Bacteroides sp. 224 TaxID=2302936 RepID=UPI0013D2BB10|nr:S9 family peptidase [Bacteroides sp. 224]NDV65114.1 S9 family peptidase [Bacteroides sp. 224]